MARNGSGVYTPPAASYPAVSGTLIESAKFNAVIDDIATALTESVAINGQTTMTGDLPMGAHKITGLANGIAATDACAYGQAGSATIAETYAATSKATPVDADVLPLADSAASFGLRKLTWANLKTTLLGAVTSINGGQIAGLRNRIINGNFAINQRAVSGTVVLAAGVYGHDRFKAGAGGCTYTFATVNNVTTLTISAGTLMQVIEGLNLQSGTHILSWSGTAQGRVDSGAYGASGVVGTAVGGTNQAIEFGTGTLSLVQYEPGAIVTPFEHRPIGLELALCQRYTQVLGCLYGYAFTTTIIQGIVPHAPFRATPTAALLTTTPYGESPVSVTPRNGIAASVYVANSSSKTGTIIRVDGFSGMVQGELAMVATDVIILSAEL